MWNFSLKTDNFLALSTKPPLFSNRQTHKVPIPPPKKKNNNNLLTKPFLLISFLDLSFSFSQTTYLRTKSFSLLWQTNSIWEFKREKTNPAQDFECLHKKPAVKSLWFFVLDSWKPAEWQTSLLLSAVLLCVFLWNWKTETLCNWQLLSHTVTLFAKKNIFGNTRSCWV